MKTAMFALQFKGIAAPPGADPMVLKVHATASNAQALAGAGGFDPSGRTATFDSEVRMKSEGSFDEDGSIDYGRGDQLTFATVGQGVVTPSPEQGVSRGSVVWEVKGGEGKLAGVTGYITSNFFFNMAGEVTDNQLAVLFLP